MNKNELKNKISEAMDSYKTELVGRLPKNTSEPVTREDFGTLCDCTLGVLISLQNAVTECLD